MNDIRTLIRIAGSRIEATTFIAALHVVAIALAAVALVLALADRAPGEPFVAWVWVAPSLVAVGLAAAAIIWSRRRQSELQVAVAVDERLDLRERLSTALHVSSRGDAFAQAAVHDAVTTARDPRSRERVRRKFAVAAPRRWWISPIIAIAAVGVLMMPQADLFAQEDPEEKEKRVQAELEVRDALEVVVKAVEDKPILKAELEGMVDEFGQKTPASSALDKPEKVKRDALKKVTELNKKLDDIVNGEKGKTAKAIEDMMGRLESLEGGPAKELADAMAEGDFSKAKQALDKMLQDAKNGNLNAEQQKAMADQLQALGNQLQQLAQQQQQLQQALKQAGMNPQLANDPQALQQAIQQAQNLNQQQKQELQQMIQAQQAAQQMCQGLGGACKQLGQAMGQGQGQQAGAGQLQQQLNQLEQMQQLLQQAQAAANACKGAGQGLGQGMNMAQALQQWKQGGGMGNWGSGRGGKAPNQRTPWGAKMTKAEAPVIDGEIIASMLIDGSPVRGESKAKLKKVVAAGATGYDEAISEDPLPRRYHEAQKHYFGELQDQVEAVIVNIENGDDAGDEAGSGTDAPADSGSGEPADGEEPGN